MLTDIKKGNKRIHPFVPNHISCLKNKEITATNALLSLISSLQIYIKYLKKTSFSKEKKGSSPKKIEDKPNKTEYGKVYFKTNVLMIKKHITKSTIIRHIITLAALLVICFFLLMYLRNNTANKTQNANIIKYATMSMI